MKPLILTALNDNTPFWYDQLIPFMLSLTDTDYSGSIGVIGYGLSAAKEQALRDNGVLLFQAAGRFDEITLDRQYTAAQIAQQPEYSHVALYDTDIWFPNPHFTLFDQIRAADKLYACFDPMAMQFVLDCVRGYGIERARQQLDGIIAEHGYLWQVGLLAGQPESWRRYRDYLDTLLTDGQFAIVYGTDTTAFNLFAAETGSVAHLPERYNCLPFWGLHISTIAADGSWLPPERARFLLNGETVEGVHVSGVHRNSGSLSSYSYINWHESRCINEGLRWRHRACVRSDQVPAQLADMLPAPLYISQIRTEDGCTFACQNNNLYLDFAGISQLDIRNGGSMPVSFKVALYRLQPHRLPHRAFALINAGTQEITFRNSPYTPHTIHVGAGETVSFYTYDIDMECRRVRWQFAFGQPEPA